MPHKGGSVSTTPFFYVAKITHFIHFKNEYKEWFCFLIILRLFKIQKKTTNKAAGWFIYFELKAFVFNYNI